MNFRCAVPLSWAMLAFTAMNPARAGDCEQILSSQAPYVIGGTTITIQGMTPREGSLSALVTRGDPTTVVITIGGQSNPAAELWQKGVLTTRIENLTTKQVTEYQYDSVEGNLTSGTELRFTRTVRTDGANASTETGVADIGGASTISVGDCSVDAIEIKSKIMSDKAPPRASTFFYAPKLGYVIKSNQGGLGPKGNIATIFAASSLELVR